jgi:diadenosine tetraphosphate (Ap4A) HIT family hydrolase
MSIHADRFVAAALRTPLWRTFVPAAFSLDSRLALDSELVCELPLSQLRLMRDARFFWLILIPRRAGCSEWFDLQPADQNQLLAESMQLSAALKRITAADKMNIAALGNIVSQLHVHVIARQQGDACWPSPVWGSAAVPASQELMQRRSAQLAQICAQLQGRSPEQTLE